MLAAISASISASSACCSLPRRPDGAGAAIGMTNPAPHCRADQPTAASVFGPQRTVAVLGRQRMQPTLGLLERGLPLRPRCHCLTASNARAPRFWVSWAGRWSRTQDLRSDDANDCAASGGEAVGLHYGAKRRTTSRPLRGGAARQLPRCLPRRIGLHRTTARDELGQHRVIHPRAGEKPCANIAALRRTWAQWPRPHMGRCAFRALARTRLTHRPTAPARRPVSVRCGSYYPSAHHDRRGDH